MNKEQDKSWTDYPHEYALKVVEVDQLKAENAALRKRVEELEAALMALSGEQQLEDRFFDYVERKAINASRSVGGGGGKYTLGGDTGIR